MVTDIMMMMRTRLKKQSYKAFLKVKLDNDDDKEN